MTDWNDIEAKAPTEGGRVPNGCYVLKCISAEDAPDKGYIFMRFDIAEGEYADYYAERGWDGIPYYAGYTEDPGNRNPRWRQERFKHMFVCMEDSTCGKWRFDGNEHNAQQFVEREVGAALRYREYVGNDGKVKKPLDIGKFDCSQEVRNGGMKPMKDRLLDGGTEARQTETSAGGSVYDDDLPF